MKVVVYSWLLCVCAVVQCMEPKHRAIRPIQSVQLDRKEVRNWSPTREVFDAQKRISPRGLRNSDSPLHRQNIAQLQVVINRVWPRDVDQASNVYQQYRGLAHILSYPTEQGKIFIKNRDLCGKIVVCLEDGKELCELAVTSPDESSFCPNQNILVSVDTALDTAVKDRISLLRIFSHGVEKIVTFPHQHVQCGCPSGPQHIGFSPDGNYFVALGRCGRADVYDFNALITRYAQH